jgi:hypothetical protein
LSVLLIIGISLIRAVSHSQAFNPSLCPPSEQTQVQEEKAPKQGDSYLLKVLTLMDSMVEYGHEAESIRKTARRLVQNRMALVESRAVRCLPDANRHGAGS